MIVFVVLIFTTLLPPEQYTCS